MEFFILLFIFIFGTIIGSFLNVVILRLNTGFTLWKRSSCFSCGKQLQWYELIPVVSFFIQKGRCRECKSKISVQYPLVEIITGILFVLIFLKDLSLFLVTFYVVIFSLLIIIAVYDIHHKIIPNKFVYLFDGIVFLSIVPLLQFTSDNFLDHFIAGIVFFLFFGLLWLVSAGRWMGLGDGKLALGIGWMLGLSSGITALVLSFWIGAIYGLFFIMINKADNLFWKTKRFTIKSEIPFAPFLILGLFIVFLFDLSFSNIQQLFAFGI